MADEFLSTCIIILQLIISLIAAFFLLFLAYLLVRLLNKILDWLGYFIHFIYWKVIIWWHGWEHDVPDYWNNFDPAEYIDRMIEMENINNSDCEIDTRCENTEHIIVVNPSGEISLGKHVKNSN